MQKSEKEESILQIEFGLSAAAVVASVVSVRENQNTATFLPLTVSVCSVITELAVEAKKMADRASEKQEQAKAKAVVEMWLYKAPEFSLLLSSIGASSELEWPESATAVSCCSF